MNKLLIFRIVLFSRSILSSNTIAGFVSSINSPYVIKLKVSFLKVNFHHIQNLWFWNRRQLSKTSFCPKSSVSWIVSNGTDTSKKIPQLLVLYRCKMQYVILTKYPASILLNTVVSVFSHQGKYSTSDTINRFSTFCTCWYDYWHYVFI